MKKLFKKVMLFAAAAMAFASCQNDGINDEVNANLGVEVTLNTTTTDVRSAFGDYNSTDKTYPTLWAGNEAWFVAVNNEYVESAKISTVSEDKKSASAKFSLSKAPTAASDGTYTLFALSPASVWSSYDLESDYLRFYIARNTQTPTATSCDPACQVLFAKSEPVQSVDAFTANFEHLSAYVKFSFLNVAEGGVVSNVSVSSEDVNLAGRYQYTPSTGKLAAYDRLEKSITLVTTSTDNLWMAVAPVDVSGKKLTFSITTDKGVLSKEVTMPATAKFESGKIVTFNVDMAGIEYPSADAGEEWYLVTNTADLTDGEYIIVGKNKDNNIVYLPSTTTSSAPAQKIIAVTGLDLSTTDAFKTTLIPEDARFFFSGSASSMTIKNADGKYLYTISNNNGVRIGTTNDTWSFAVHANNSKSLAMKSASQNRYISLYNSQDWRSYTTSYNSYPSSNNTQNGVTFLYKKVSYEPAIVADAISVPATYTTGEATYTVKNMEGDDVTATFATEWISTEAANGVITYEIEPNYTGAVRTGKITLSSAKYGITKDVTVTQAADQFKVSATSVSLKVEANSTATFTVTSTYAATIAVADATKWSVTPTSVAGGASAVTVTVKALTANATAEAITGAITITRTEDSKKLTVTASQAAAEQGGGDEPVVVLSEQFDNKSTSDSSNAITTSTFSNFSGATDKAYKSQYGGIKLGTSSKVGYITTKSLDLSSAFTVQIDACKYGSDSGNITVTCGSQVKTINNSSLKAAGTFTTFTLEFTAATASSTVKIATSSKRAYIDNVVITRK